MNDFLGPDAPERGLGRVCLALGAGGVLAVFEHGCFAANALGALGVEPGVVLAHRAQAVDETVPEVVGQFKPFSIGDGAVALGQLRVTLSKYTFGRLVVDDPVGLQHAALIINLNVADRCDRILVAVVLHLAGVNQHPVLLAGFAAGAVRDAVAQGLGAGRGRNGRTGKQQSCEQHAAHRR